MSKVRTSVTCLLVSNTNQTNGVPNMTQQDRNIARKEQMIRELASDLADLVATGDLTDKQANEWLIAKQDQWFGGDR